MVASTIPSAAGTTMGGGGYILHPCDAPSHRPTLALPPAPPGELKLFLSPSIIFILFFFGVPIKADSFNHPSFKRETGERQGESAVNLETHLTPPC